MANTFKFGNGEWAVGKETALAYNDENSNFKPLAFTFDRSTGATVVNKQGLIETVGTDEPRIDFLNNTKGHLLLEPSRQNVITYSEDFSDSSWTKVNTTITSNNTTSPDGTINATLCDYGSGSYINTGFASTGDTDVTVSVFAKADSVSSLRIRESFYIGSSCVYDLNLGTASAGGTIDNYGNGWYRCSFTYNLAAGQTNVNFIFDSNTQIGSLFLWGATCELASYATSYIPTQGSAVTRSAESILIKGFQDTILNGGDAPFALFIDFENYTLETLGDGLLFYDETDGTSTEGRAYLYNSSAGFGQGWNDNPVSFTNNSSVKLLWNYTSLTEGYVWKDGTKGSLNSGTNAVDFDYLKIVSQFNLLKINTILIYNTALTDTEAQNLTS